MLDDENVTNVRIITSTKDLALQLYDELGALVGFFDTWLSIYNMEEIEDMPPAEKDTAVFIDEADEVLTNIITFGTENNLNGIYYCQDAYSTYYFSATMPDPVLKMLKGCVGGIETLAFPSQYQISTKDNQHCKITGYLF